jgi:FAD/FMN-containing dehydrogenase
LTPPAAAVITNAAHAGLPTDRPVLAIGVEGTDSSVAWQIEQLRREIVPFGVQDLQTIISEAASPIWSALTEFQTPADDPITFQANLRPSRAMEFLTVAHAEGVLAQCHAVNGLIVGHIPAEPGGGTPPFGTLTKLRKFARHSGGNLVVRHADESLSSGIDWLGDPEPSAQLMKQLKTKLDPNDLLNPTWFDAKQS